MTPATRLAARPATTTAARAPRATALIFVVHGLIIGDWAPHIPTAEARAGVGPDGLGPILLCMAPGEVGAMVVTRATVARFGSGRVTASATLAFCAAFVPPIWTSTAVPLVAAPLILGVTPGPMGVAMSALAIDVEATLEHPAMSSFHGWFSVGAMTGAAGVRHARLPRAAGSRRPAARPARRRLLRDRPGRASCGWLSQTFGMPTAR